MGIICRFGGALLLLLLGLTQGLARQDWRNDPQSRCSPSLSLVGNWEYFMRSSNWRQMTNRLREGRGRRGCRGGREGLCDAAAADADDEKARFKIQDASGRLGGHRTPQETEPSVQPRVGMSSVKSSTKIYLSVN